MTIDKTKGQALYFSQWGGERPIPPEFVAAMERAEERQSGFPKDAEIPQYVKDDPDVVEAFFDTRERRTNEKVLVVIRKKNGVIGPLRDIRTTDNGQSVQVEATMFRGADTTFTIAEATATQDVSVKDLGNSWSIQEVAISGSYVDGVFVASIFQGIELSTRREDPVPSEFRLGLPLTEVQSVVSGTVAQPTLGVNDLEAKERQIEQHKKLLTRLTRDGVTLPFSLIGRRTNEKKQLVVVTDTYRLAGTAPTITTTKDVKVLDLGEGHEVVTTEDIPAVFGGERYVKEIDDLLPPRFRGIIPSTLVRQTLVGTASAPTLDPGELRKTEEQITVLTKVVETLARLGVNFPIEVIDSATTTEYGGGKVTIRYYIADEGTLAVDEGEGVVSSKLTKLGEGHEMRETVARVASEWPPLRFSRFDPRLQMMVSGTEQVVGINTTTPGISGTSNEIVTEVEKLDGYRELKRVTTRPLAGVDNYVKVLYGNNTNVDVPPHLESIIGYIDIGGGGGSYSSTGSYVLSESKGYGSLSLRGSAQASSSAIPEIGWVVKIPRTNNIPAIHVILYVAEGLSRAAIITAINSAMGSPSPAILDWPKFRPQPITVKGVGGKLTARVGVDSSVADNIGLDYLGAIKFFGNSRNEGAEESRDASVVTKTWNLPPTIHGASSAYFSGQTDLWTTDNGLAPVGVPGGSATPLYSASGTITSGTSGANPTKTVSCSSRGTLAIISSTAATSDKSDYSGLTLCVHRLVSEPDPVYPRTRVFAEIVNFADIIP